MNNPCSNCLRECELETSFCGRRDFDNVEQDQRPKYIFNVDRLFDKPILYFTSNIKVLSIGSWGCNFRCLGCQNSYLSWATENINFNSSIRTADDIISLAIKNGCEGICYTFNEPAVIIDDILEICKVSKDFGIMNFLVTNSTLTTQATKKIAPYIDAVATDIKHINDSFYYDHCGANGIIRVAKKILSCIKSFYDEGCHVEVRTNLIPGLNDDFSNVKATATWIRENLSAETPWHLTRFFPAHLLSYIEKTPFLNMKRAYQIAIEEGLKRVNLFLSKGCDCAKESYLNNDNKNDLFHKCCCGTN